MISREQETPLLNERYDDLLEFDYKDAAEWIARGIVAIAVLVVIYLYIKH